MAKAPNGPPPSRPLFDTTFGRIRPKPPQPKDTTDGRVPPFRGSPHRAPEPPRGPLNTVHSVYGWKIACARCKQTRRTLYALAGLDVCRICADFLQERGLRA